MNQSLATIWIVCEDEDDVLLMEDSLYRLDRPCQLLIFTDAPALLDHVNRFHETPSLILIDYFLPGMSGPELTEALRLIPWLAGIPISWFGVNSPDATGWQALGVKWCWDKPGNYAGWQPLMQQVCQMSMQVKRDEINR